MPLPDMLAGGGNVSHRMAEHFTQTEVLNLTGQAFFAPAAVGSFVAMLLALPRIKP